MSELECRYGHFMPNGSHSCPICGGPPVRLDGMTARQMQQHDEMERMKASSEYRDEWPPRMGPWDW